MCVFASSLLFFLPSFSIFSSSSSSPRALLVLFPSIPLSLLYTCFPSFICSSQLLLIDRFNTEKNPFFPFFLVKFELCEDLEDPPEDVAQFWNFLKIFLELWSSSGFWILWYFFSSSGSSGTWNCKPLEILELSRILNPLESENLKLFGILNLRKFPELIGILNHHGTWNFEALLNSEFSLKFWSFYEF